MSTIPKTRQDLIKMTQNNFQKLMEVIESISEEDAKKPCDDTWSIKDLLIVRTWWTKAITSWIKKGKKNLSPITPHSQYNWKQTPELNNYIVQKGHQKSYSKVLKELTDAYDHIESTIDSLSDEELLNIGVFEWAGDKWPIARWLSVNTARQYHTARITIKKALKS